MPQPQGKLGGIGESSNDVMLHMLTTIPSHLGPFNTQPHLFSISNIFRLCLLVRVIHFGINV